MELDELLAMLPPALRARGGPQRFGKAHCFDCGSEFSWRLHLVRIPRHFCDACLRKRALAATARWREQQRRERARSLAGRTCDGCNKPMPEGRADRNYCSSACRQKAYRARKKDPAASYQPPGRSAHCETGGREPSNQM
jgi:hypothetical protein